MPPSPHHDRLVKLILSHMPLKTLGNGTIVCTCERSFETEVDFANHAAQMVVDNFSGVLQQERVEGQLTLLAAAMRHFGPSEAGASARSRSVYTGAQFAGWCRERAHALHRSHGQGKPPTHSRTDQP